MLQAFYLRGLAERELQDFDRALDDFKRMIQIDGENVMGRYQPRARALRHAAI